MKIVSLFAVLLAPALLFAQEPAVYMTRSISAESLMSVYRSLNHPALEKTAVKISIGEPGGTNFLKPALIKNLVQEVKGTIVEGNTAYGGRRSSAAQHRQVAKEHGFSAIAPIDILDERGTINLPVRGGQRIKNNIVGSHFTNYNFYVILSHFKGHGMGGFGGAIKNMSVGIASPEGKLLIHSGGVSTKSWRGAGQDAFLEAMAESAKSVADSLGRNIIYINVMNNLSVDCDCVRNPAEPDMHDIGILASLDPVALDQACVDLVYAAKDGAALVQRIESREGIHTLEHAEKIGLGSRSYRLIPIDR